MQIMRRVALPWTTTTRGRAILSNEATHAWELPDPCILSAPRLNLYLRWPKVSPLIMSSSWDKAKEHRRALRAFAESENVNSSDNEDGLDIIGSSRKALDISQYIDGQLMSLPVVDLGADSGVVLTQSQSQSQHANIVHVVNNDADEIFDDDLDIAEAPRPQRALVISSEDEGAFANAIVESESEWSDEDPRAVYREFKNRKTVKRKRVAAETNRIRAERKTKSSAAASIVGRKPQSTK